MFRNGFSRIPKRQLKRLVSHRGPATVGLNANRSDLIPQYIQVVVCFFFVFFFCFLLLVYFCIFVNRRKCLY